MPFFHVLRIIQILWAIVIVYWIACSFGNKKTKMRQSRGSRLVYVAGAVAAAYFVSHQQGLDFLLMSVSVATQCAGVLLCAAGAAIAIWARSILGRNWSGFVMIKDDHELIQSGPYRLVRHPIYSGLLLMFAGTFLAVMPTARAGLLELVLLLAFYIKARHEEHILAGEFGGQYAAYKQRVKSALIPFVI